MAIRHKAKADDPTVNDSAIALAEPESRTEKWAKVLFDFRECPGSTWSITYQSQVYRFQDGREYDLPLQMVKDLNNNCQVVRRQKVRRAGDDLSSWVRTNKFNRRIYFEIIETYEKDKE